MIGFDWVVEHYHYAKNGSKLVMYPNMKNEETARGPSDK